MRVNRGLLGWGVFFIVLGAVPVAVRAGVVTEEWVRTAWQLWPLLLIGIGLGLVLERTRFGIVGGLVIAVTFGLMGGALIATGFRFPFGDTACGAGEDGERFAEHRGEFTGEAAVSIDLDCGELHAGAADGSGWLVSGQSTDGAPPDIVAGPERLALRSPESAGLGVLGGGGRYELTLPRAAPVRVQVSVNAGQADLDLAGMQVPSVSASVNAGAANLDLSSSLALERVSASVNAGSLSIALPAPTGTIEGSASVNAGTLELCVPPGTPLRVRVGGSPLGAHNLGDRGLVQDDEVWTTPGSAGAAAVVSLNLSVNLGSFTLDPEDGCD
jgi:hypothetical protein